MIPSRPTVAILPALAVSLAVTAGVAQQPAQPTFRTGANVVLTDVFVTRDGVPVTDLAAGDFAILEDGVPQVIRTFERVRIPGGTAQAPRTAAEPATVAESRALVADPRRRAFILFLDTYHVTPEASARIAGPLVTFLNRVIGPDDVVAVMTPTMAPSELVFSPRTESVQAFLAARPRWGVRHEWIFDVADREEALLQACTRRQDPADFRALLGRWREKKTFDALEGLIAHLDGLRDGRKPVLVVSEGWYLYQSAERLALPSDGRVPERGPVGVGPDGRLGIGDRRGISGTPHEVCDALRQRIAFEETRSQFRTTIVGDANRTNVSFYTIDPRGLAVVDQPSSAPGDRSVHVDRQQLADRLGSLRTLAEATDGLAIVDTHAQNEGLRRVAADLTSYYLIGYQSTNAALDGKFRKVRIAVSRPGVQVRAREGYRAVAPRTAADPSAAGAGAPPASPVIDAIARLGTIRADLPLLVRAEAGAALVDEPGGRRVHVVAEIGLAQSRAEEWAKGGRAQITIKAGDGTSVATGEATLPAGERVVQADLAVPLSASGDHRVQVRLAGASPAAVFTDTTTVTLAPPGTRLWAPRLFRRGPSTGLQHLPTADVRFRRSERLRLDLSTAPAVTVTARLADRHGATIAVPVTVTAEEQDGHPHVRLDVLLAPLAPGDYAIDIQSEPGGPAEHVIVPFRVVP